MAKIYDIDDEDIQKEYMSAFNRVVYLFNELKEDYEERGFNENSDEILLNYQNSFNLSNLNLKFKILLPFIRYYWNFNSISLFQIKSFFLRLFMQFDSLLSFLQICFI